jgi:23S rRNA pseudouridine1911/1915/1917 synthase
LIQDFKRQALHAERLSFEHPRSHEMVSFEAPLPDDFENLLEALIRYD